MGIYSGVWCEKGVIRRLCKNALRVCGEIKEGACVHYFWLAKPLRSFHSTKTDNPQYRLRVN